MAVCEFYVYHWIRPDTGAVFYVGKGKGKRDIAPKDTNRHFMNIVAKLRRDGLEPIVARVADNLSEQDAFDLERAEIARIGRKEFGGPLVNLTDGGEGASGRVFSAETRAKLSASKKGWVVSEETRERMRIASRNSRTPEVLAKIGAASMGRIPSAETRAKLSAALRNRSPESRNLVRVANSNPSPETRARKSLAARSAGPRADNKSGFKGVSFDRLKNKWLAKIFVDSEQRHIGVFSTAEEAARAYDAAAYAAWGDNCYQNLPRSVITARVAS